MKIKNLFKILYRDTLIAISVFSFLLLLSLALNRQAKRNYDNKENYQAIAKLSFALKINPFLFPAYFNLGNCFLELEDYPRAIDAYKKSVVLDPDNFEAYENLAIAYSLRKEFPKSLAVLNMARKKDGFSASMAALYNDLYKLYVAQTMEEGMDAVRKDNAERAVERFKKAIALAPEFALAYHNVGHVYFFKGDFENASRYLEKSVALDSHNAEAFALLGEIMFQEKDFKTAATYFAKAATLNPDNAKIHNNLSFAYYRCDNYEEAITHMRKAFALEPWNVTYWHALASILRDNGDYDESLEHFLGIAKKQPDIIEMHSDIAGIYFLNGKVEEGVGELDEEIRQRKKQLSKDPKDIDSLFVLAKAYKDKAEYEQSQAVLNEILVQAPHLKEQVSDMAAVLESIMREKKQTLIAQEQHAPLSQDRVFLNNERHIVGRIVYLNTDKVVLEIALPETVGTVTLPRRLIKKIERGG